MVGYRVVQGVGCNNYWLYIAGNNVADLMVVLKTLPTKEAVEALGNKVRRTVLVVLIFDFIFLIRCGRLSK